MPPSLTDELLAMASEDERVRSEVAADGALFEGYHPRMRAVQDRNAARLRAVLDEVGWPGPSRVGEAAARAAWLVLQHAIGHPALMRRGLALLQQAPAGEVSAVEVAMLEDRIRTCEGRSQRYGTQFDWDEHGEMSPLPIEDPTTVDGRRADVGLPPLAEAVARQRAAAAASRDRPPADWAARRREIEDWARACGWRPADGGPGAIR